MEDQDAPSMGHNRPPDDMDLLAEMLNGIKPSVIGPMLTPIDRDEYKAIRDDLARVAADSAIWLKAGEVKDAETSAIATDHTAQLIALRKRIEALQKSTKKIWADLGAQAYDGYKPLLDAAEKGIEKMRNLQEPFLLAEQARKDEEARRLRADADALRARQAAEAAAAEESGDILRMAEAEAISKEVKQVEKAARATEKAKVSVASASGLGGRTRLVTVQMSKVENYTVNMLRLKDHPDMIALIDRLVAAEVRAASFDVNTDTIPGVHIWTEQKAQ